MKTADPTSPTTLLLVEDDPSLRACLLGFFADHGICARAADCNQLAWEAICADLPDVCILDLNLPDGCGLELLDKITQAGLAVRVVVMTALPITHLLSRISTSKVSAWLTKPVDPQRLLDCIRGD